MVGKTAESRPAQVDTKVNCLVETTEGKILSFSVD